MKKNFFISFFLLINVFVFAGEIKFKMVQIPNENFKILTTEVTQELFTAVMNSNPSKIKGDNLPVNSLDFHEPFKFCNELSELKGLTPVYTYEPKYYSYKVNPYANGFRLPTPEEWTKAASGGKRDKFSGSKKIDKVGWYKDNSGETIHAVAQKDANAYGLYDMTGNVYEVCYESNNVTYLFPFGGCFASSKEECELGLGSFGRNNIADSFFGFRIVCNADISEDQSLETDYIKEKKQQKNNAAKAEMEREKLAQRIIEKKYGSSPTTEEMSAQTFLTVLATGGSVGLDEGAFISIPAGILRIYHMDRVANNSYVYLLGTSTAYATFTCCYVRSDHQLSIINNNIVYEELILEYVGRGEYKRGFEIVGCDCFNLSPNNYKKYLEWKEQLRLKAKEIEDINKNPEKYQYILNN